ncbi:MAG: isoprenylcysteine carboxylmethyltransferase family protein [Candidatus Altiarchaeota archaeon]
MLDYSTIVKGIVLLSWGIVILVSVANPLTLMFRRFLRRIFSKLGEIPYLILLALMLLSTLLLAYSLRERILSHRLSLPPAADYAGVLILLSGFFLDFWATSSLGWKAVLNIPTAVGSEGMRRLTREGAYAFSRNPLYVGDALIVAGLLLLTGYASLILLLVIYLAHVLVQVRLEEHELTETFGKEYYGYMRTVPRFL